MFSQLRAIIILLSFAIFAVPTHADSGQGGAQALMATAMLLGSLSPAIGAAAQASADKANAKTNAKAQVEMAEISADTSKFMADKQAEVAGVQAQTSKDIVQMQQSGETERKAMTLAADRYARDQQFALENTKLAYQMMKDKFQMGLEALKAQQTIQLGYAQFRASLAAAGLSKGFLRTQDSSSGLNVQPANSVAYGAAAGFGINPLPQTRLLVSAQAPTGLAIARALPGSALIQGSSPLLRFRSPSPVSGSLAVRPSSGFGVTDLVPHRSGWGAAAAGMDTPANSTGHRPY